MDMSSRSKKEVASYQIPKLVQQNLSKKQLGIIKISYGDIAKLPNFIKGVDNFLTLIHDKSRNPASILFTQMTGRTPPISADGTDSCIFQPVSCKHQSHLKYFKLGTNGQRLATLDLLDQYQSRCKVFDKTIMQASSPGNLEFVLPQKVRSDMLDKWERASTIITMTLRELFQDPDHLLESSFADTGPYELWEEIKQKLSNYKTQQINDPDHLISHHNWSYRYTTDFAINRQGFAAELESVIQAREAFYGSDHTNQQIRDAFALTLKHERIFILLHKLKSSQGTRMQRFFELNQKYINDLIEKLRSGSEGPDQIYQSFCKLVTDHENQFGCDTKSSIAKAGIKRDYDGSPKRSGDDDTSGSSRSSQRYWDRPLHQWCYLCHYPHATKKCHDFKHYAKTGEYTVGATKRLELAPKKFPRGHDERWKGQATINKLKKMAKNWKSYQAKKAKTNGTFRNTAAVSKSDVQGMIQKAVQGMEKPPPSDTPSSSLGGKDSNMVRYDADTGNLFTADNKFFGKISKKKE